MSPRYANWQGVKKKAETVNSYTTAGTRALLSEDHRAEIAPDISKDKKLRAHTLRWQSFSPVALSGVFSLLMSCTHKTHSMTEGVTHQKNSIHSRLLAWRGTILFYKDQRQSLIARSFRWPDLQASFFRHGMNIVCKVKLVFGSTGIYRGRLFLKDSFTLWRCVCVCVFFVCRKKWNQENAWVSDTFFFTQARTVILFFLRNMPTSGCCFFLPFKMWSNNTLISFPSKKTRQKHSPNRINSAFNCLYNQRSWAQQKFWCAQQRRPL